MKALIAMSGGVDSSVAALFMKQQGYECIGCTMKLFEAEETDELGRKACCTADDADDARRVAYRLGMRHYVFNFKDEFQKTVMNKFGACYLAGLTPNPCIDCNRFLKFEKLYERAMELGCDKIVTGHYARIEEENGHHYLRKGLDTKKDQSYVLYQLTEEMLRHIAFPLGTYTKEEIRAIAEENGFINAGKPDSQDICFVPDGDYASVVERLTGVAAEPGNFVDASGRVLGTHKGVIHYTVGQRRGLGIAYTEPLYVIRIEPKTNTVVLGTEKELYVDHTHIGAFRFITGETPAEPFRAGVRTRYHKPEAPCTVTPLGSGRARIDFDTPERSVTPGQAAVFYDGDTVLGGGTIER